MKNLSKKSRRELNEIHLATQIEIEQEHRRLFKNDATAAKFIRAENKFLQTLKAISNKNEVTK